MAPHSSGKLGVHNGYYKNPTPSLHSNPSLLRISLFSPRKQDSIFWGKKENQREWQLRRRTIRGETHHRRRASKACSRRRRCRGKWVKSTRRQRQRLPRGWRRWRKGWRRARLRALIGWNSSTIPSKPTRRIEDSIERKWFPSMFFTLLSNFLLISWRRNLLKLCLEDLENVYHLIFSVTYEDNLPACVVWLIYYMWFSYVG